MGKSRYKKAQPERVDIKQIISLQEELDQLEEEHGIAHTPTFVEKWGDRYYAFKEAHTTKNPVQRKRYCWLCLLGPFGVHHFYASHWVKGLIYLAFCWTGITAAMAFIDWMIAFPMKADEEGKIWI